MTVKEPSSTKTFLLKVSVDVTQLEASYKEADPTFILESTEDIEQAVLEECGWIKSSGISVSSIEEVKE